MFYAVPQEGLFDVHVLASPGGIGLDVDPPPKRIRLVLWHDDCYRDAAGAVLQYTF